MLQAMQAFDYADVSQNLSTVFAIALTDAVISTNKEEH
jgi:hypothetical protein